MGYSSGTAWSRRVAGEARDALVELRRGWAKAREPSEMRGGRGVGCVDYDVGYGVGFPVQYVATL